MKSLFGGSAVIAAALLLSSLILSAKSSAAETLLFQLQQPAVSASLPQKQEPQGPSPSAANADDIAKPTAGKVNEATEPKVAPALLVIPPAAYVATAYSLRGRTASGKPVQKGMIAADPRLLPLGSRVHIEAGGYSGEYLVADTGGAVRGRRIDIWTPTTHEAMRFGRRVVKLTILGYGPKRFKARKGTDR
jgi:3D (Asp-Asp-Asp) domain-containing protein